MSGLCDLPDEVIVYIFSLLPSRQQVLTVPLVCQRFRRLVGSVWYWKTRYLQLCSTHHGAQPLLELPSLRLWQEGCIQGEFARATVTNPTIQQQMQATLRGELYLG